MTLERLNCRQPGACLPVRQNADSSMRKGLCAETPSVNHNE